MLQKIATILFVMIQCIFILCALVVIIWGIKIPSQSTACVFVVTCYALGSASRKIFDVWLACCRRTPGKGMMDL